MLGQPGSGRHPVQLYHLPREGLRCITEPPGRAFADTIHYYWRLDIEAPRISLNIIPDTAVDLVVAPQVPDFSALFFPKAEAYSLDLEGPVTYLGVCMPFAGVEGLFGQDIDLLRGLVPGSETTHLLNLGNFHKELSPTSGLDQFGRWIETHFSRFAARKRSARELDMKKLLENLEQDQVTTIAKKWRISERQFRRLSGELFGLSPKKIQNIIRLQNTLAELLSVGRETGTEFYDDSHRIRELKRLTGLTPGQIRKMAEKYNSGA